MPNRRSCDELVALVKAKGPAVLDGLAYLDEIVDIDGAADYTGLKASAIRSYHGQAKRKRAALAVMPARRAPAGDTEVDVARAGHDPGRSPRLEAADPRRVPRSHAWPRCGWWQALARQVVVGGTRAVAAGAGRLIAFAVGASRALGALIDATAGHSLPFGSQAARRRDRSLARSVALNSWRPSSSKPATARR